MHVVKIIPENIDLLQSFLNGSSKYKNHFRYYNKRDLNVVGQHLCTLLIIENEIPICYGHLDPEGDLVWLGIAVADGFVGKKWGSTMLSLLIQEARAFKVPIIHLTVDNDNLAAISLYEKNGFVIIRKEEHISTYALSIG